MPEQKPLREALKSWLEQENLSDEELSTLQRERPTSITRYLRGRSLKPYLAVAAVFCLLSLNIFWQQYQSDAAQDRIVKEILTNHTTIKPLDLTTNSMNEMNRFFKRLDFSPFLSKRVDMSQLTPLGGRYCTLQGVIALQLRLKTADGKVVTYYQSRYDKTYFGKIPDVERGAKPGVVYERGVKMSIWREHGVVNVLAQPS